MVDWFALGLFAGYTSVLVSLWAFRNDIANWVKPIGIVLVPYLLAWMAFYGIIAFCDTSNFRDTMVSLSRFGNTAGFVFLWVLLMRLRGAAKHNARDN